MSQTPTKTRERNVREKIKMAIWMYNRLIEKHPGIFKAYKATYKQEFKGKK